MDRVPVCFDMMVEDLLKIVWGCRRVKMQCRPFPWGWTLPTGVRRC